MFGKKKQAETTENPWGSAAPTSEGASHGGDNFWGVSDSPPDSPAPASSPTSTPPPADKNPSEVGVPRTVPEMVEPIFLFLCRTHRLVEEGRELDYAQVRAEAEDILDGIEKNVRKNPTIQQQFEKLREPIHWFLDYWFGSSGEFRTIQREWNKYRMGEEPDGEEDGVLTGDEAFFVELDKALKSDPKDELATERLAFFYTALGTGFHGPYYRATPENENTLREYMGKIYPRVREFIDGNPSGRVTPESYKFTDKRDFVAPARDRPMLLFCSLLCLVASLLLGYFWLYGNQKERLESFLNDLQSTTERQPN